MDYSEKVIVLDTETTNNLDDPICYDVGFAVVNYTGKVYETFSFAVADIFLDKELMSYAYFVDKVPQYWEEIRTGKRQLKQFRTIKSIFREVCQKYSVNKVYAHNARFDYRSCTLTQRYLTNSKSRYFFPCGTEIHDTLKMARTILKNNDNYGEFCYNNDYLTSRGQRRYTAEIIYRYITGQNDFSEEHKGIDDVLIEKELLRYFSSIAPDTESALWSK